MVSNLCLEAIQKVIKSNLSVRLISDKTRLVEPKSILDYRAKQLREEDWETVSHEDKVEATTRKWIEWEFGGGKAEIYGFYVTDSKNAIIWEERSTIPFEVLRKGDKLRVRPKIVFEEVKE